MQEYVLYYLLYHLVCILFFGTGLIIEWSPEHEAKFQAKHNMGFKGIMVCVVFMAGFLLPIYILEELRGKK
jgi:hypothetical protein